MVIEDFKGGEKDGTNDVYGDLTLRKNRKPKAVEIKEPSQNKARETTAEKGQGETTYTAVSGDTLCSICRKFYGDDSPNTSTRLANYIGKSNPNLLMFGEILKIPPPLP